VVSDTGYSVEARDPIHCTTA